MAEADVITALTADVVRRIVTYTPDLTYYGDNSPSAAIASAIAAMGAAGEANFRALLRRQTLSDSTGDALTAVMAEFGTARLGASRAVVPVILQPQRSLVTAITDGRLEVEDSTVFEVGDSVRLTLDDGSESEILSVLAITAGTGPNGDDELDVGLILGSYDPTTETVRVLLRHTLDAGTVLTSITGISYETLAAVTIGDSNPAMAGESAALALADKVWCEAQTAGAAGNVEAFTLTKFAVADPDVRALFNPVRSTGAADTEADFDAKYRTAHVGQLAAAETPAMLEALAVLGDSTVLRAIADESFTLGNMRLVLLTRGGGGLSADALAALGTFMASRLRSQLTVEIVNMEVTAIEVTAQVALNAGTGTVAERLAAAWRSAADLLANHLDYRKWEPGTDVLADKLFELVDRATGVSSVALSSFTPAADVAVGATSVPKLVRLVLTDLATGTSFGAALEPSYA